MTGFQRALIGAGAVLSVLVLVVLVVAAAFGVGALYSVVYP